MVFHTQWFYQKKCFLLLFASTNFFGPRFFFPLLVASAVTVLERKILNISTHSKLFRDRFNVTNTYIYICISQNDNWNSKAAKRIAIFYNRRLLLDVIPKIYCISRLCCWSQSMSSVLHIATVYYIFKDFSIAFEVGDVKQYLVHGSVI